tara:strand:- start:317 stop:586 length:270 start_codon:yes stop_codon:yes gene_type:complete
MTYVQPQVDEAPLDVSLSRRAFIAAQWACFWFCVGLIAGATWGDALIYGAGIGFCLGWLMRVGIVRYLWWRLTFREFQMWRPFDWRRFF